MINFQEQGITITKVSTNFKQEGDNKGVPYVVLNLLMTTDAKILDTLDPQLRPALFTATPPADIDPEFDLHEDALPYVRLAKLKAVGWTYYGAGYTLTLHDEISKRKPVIIGSCTIDDIKLKAEHGALVTLTYRLTVQSDGSVLKAIYTKLGRKIPATLEPPSVDDGGQEDIEND